MNGFRFAILKWESIKFINRNEKKGIYSKSNLAICRMGLFTDPVIGR